MLGRSVHCAVDRMAGKRRLARTLENAVTDTHAPDEVFQEVHEHFDEKELADLTLVIVTINARNPIAIGFRAEPGHYETGATS